MFDLTLHDYNSVAVIQANNATASAWLACMRPTAFGACALPWPDLGPLASAAVLAGFTVSGLQ